MGKRWCTSLYYLPSFTLKRFYLFIIFTKELLEAEETAKKSGKNIHSRQTAPVHRIQDASSDSNKAKNIFPFLQRNREQEGIVEYVVHGGLLQA